MSNDKTQKAVVDRVVDGFAVFLVGDSEQEHITDVNTLPHPVEGGQIWNLVFDEDTITHMTRNIVEENDTKTRISRKMALLRQRKQKK